jgi:hypothetical protein
MLSPLLPNQSAFATFPGENGKNSFDRDLGSGDSEIYVMNKDGSGQTNLTGNIYYDINPSWSPDVKPACELDSIVWLFHSASSLL